jgi:TIR domain
MRTPDQIFGTPQRSSCTDKLLAASAQWARLRRELIECAMRTGNRLALHPSLDWSTSREYYFSTILQWHQVPFSRESFLFGPMPQLRIRRFGTARPDNAQKHRAVMDYDFFISHASEDKVAVVRPLVNELKSRGYRVWYDEYCLKVGDSLSAGIDRGLAASKFGIVVLSPAFFKKHWTQRELRGLVALDEQGRSKILPVWHNVTKADVVKASPTLADIIALDTANGLPQVVEALSDVARPMPPTIVEANRTAMTSGPTYNSGYGVFVHSGFFLEKDPMNLLTTLANDTELHGWHFGRFRYSSGKISGSLDDAAIELQLFMESQVLGRDGCALIAHSIGGLVAQQAILNSQILSDRLTLLALLGVPSAGLRVSRLIGFFRRTELREIDAGGKWIAALRANWAERFGERPPFKVAAVAAAMDEIVPAESSLGPFPSSQQFVVPGSHESIIKPKSQDDVIVQLLRHQLTGGLPGLSAEIKLA